MTPRRLDVAVFFDRLCTTDMFSSVGQQRQVASLFDSHSYQSLMPGARTYLAPRADTATIGEKTLQKIDSLVVDHTRAILTERTDFSSPGEFLASSETPLSALKTPP